MPQRNVRRRTVWLAVLALCAPALAVSQVSAAHAAATTITIDGSTGAQGRMFDGFGFESAGANTRLLHDYPANQRTEILDYLFKPDFGAAAQILKVEIGGDTNSTDGAEPSHEHVKGTVDCSRGYEWWLMQQAKARNSNIKLIGLAWGAPGWVGVSDPNNPHPGKPYFWSTDMINYVVDWLGCAKQNGLSIDYLGGWNEEGFNKSWYESLKSTLTADGYGSVKIVADDGNSGMGWSVADALASDPAFNSAVDIVGTHCLCATTANALGLAKPLWNSEYTAGTINGAGWIASLFNHSYIDYKVTSELQWPPVAGIYPNLPYGGAGSIIANQPWSGNYSVGQNIWAMAHTTQFAQPGWYYVDKSYGYLSGGGSYVTLKAPDNSAYSTVIETSGASGSQTASFTVANGLPADAVHGAVHVWATKLGSSVDTDNFAKQADPVVTNGSYSLTLQAGYIYTVTTTVGQAKGRTTPPAANGLSLPYSDTFGGYAVGQEAKYFADMNGSFEMAACGGGRTGNCLRQMAPTLPLNWAENSDPYTLAGDGGWSNYTVSSDVLLEQPGAVDLMGRVGSQAGFAPAAINSYQLRVTDGGHWSIVKTDQSTWENLGGTMVDSPAVASQAPGEFDAFVRGSDNALWQKTWTGSSWANWSSLGGPTGGTFTGAPAVTSWGNGRLDVFVRGTDGALYHRYYASGAWSSTWENLGGYLTDGPAVASQGSGELDVFVRGGDGALWSRSWTGTAWTSWTRLGAPASGSFTGAPAAASSGNGHDDVFVQGTDKALYHLSYANGAWSTTWENLGGTISSSPAAVSMAANELEVFAQGTDGAVWQQTWTGSSWAGWSSVGGPSGGASTGAAPAVTNWGTGRPDIFVRGADNALHHNNPLPTVLAAGDIGALGTTSWHRLALSFSGTQISAAIDGQTVGTVGDASYASGQIGLGTVGWHNAQFGNLTVTSP